MSSGGIGSVIRGDNLAILWLEESSFSAEAVGSPVRSLTVTKGPSGSLAIREIEYRFARNRNRTEPGGPHLKKSVISALGGYVDGNPKGPDDVAGRPLRPYFFIVV